MPDAITKQDFLNAAADAVSAYPVALQYYRLSDPRLIAPLAANATMLALLSQQMSVAEVEPFLKARDATVLADATLKGILPVARPCKVTLNLTNKNASAVTLLSGRRLFDPQGRIFMLDAQVTIPAKVGMVDGTATITATQHSYREVQHTVSGTVPFYELLVPFAGDGSVIETLTITDDDGLLEYAPGYMIQPGGDTTRLYHVETNEFREWVVRFGAEDVYGYQPENGTLITLQVYDTFGEIILSNTAQFTLEYILDANETDVTLELDSVQNNGTNPPSIQVLRVMSQYPALYDDNAVYLGNFDFIVRKFMPDARFLSVWNEWIEEQARGPSLDNINTLFVSYVIDGLSDEDAQAAITTIIKRADDSYRVTFIERDNIEQPLTVVAQVAPVHDKTTVELQITNYILANYGDDSPNTSVGGRPPFNKQQMYEELKKAVVALQDPRADITLSFGSTPDPLPEQFRYISADSLTVTVEKFGTSTGVWN